MIDDLIELVNIVTKKKIHQIEILTEDTQLNTKTKILLDGIRDGKIRTDKQAMDLLYPDSNRKAYLKLRKRLFDRLLNTLFFLDVKKTGNSVVGSLRLDAYKTFSQLMIILQAGKRDLSVKIAKNLIDKITGAEMYSLEFLLYNFLQEHYSVWEVNSAEVQRYTYLFKKSQKNLEALQMIVPIWAELGNLILNKRALSLNPERMENLRSKIAYIDTKYSDDFPYIAKSRYYSSKCFYYWVIQDYPSQITLCYEALEVLDISEAKYLVPIVAMRTYLGIAHMNLLEYTKADEIFNTILNVYTLTPGKSHWYNIYNYQFLTKVFLRSYNEAALMLNDVLSVRGFSKMDPKWREPWLIKEAYMNLLLKIGKLESEDEIKMRPFRLKKFMNMVPHYYKDKSGLNVSVLVAQFLYLLVDEKTEDLYDKLDSLRQYSFRYLKRDATFRSNCFVKMLMTLPKAHFHPVGVVKRTEDLWEKLKATPMTIGAQSYEVEIIPYEHLWELVMEILENRIQKK